MPRQHCFPVSPPIDRPSSPGPAPVLNLDHASHRETTNPTPELAENEQQIRKLPAEREDLTEEPPVLGNNTLGPILPTGGAHEQDNVTRPSWPLSAYYRTA